MSVSGFNAPDIDGVMLQLCGALELFLYRGGSIGQIAAVLQQHPDGTFLCVVVTRTRLLRETTAKSPERAAEMSAQLSEGETGCLPIFHLDPTGQGLTWLDLTSPVNSAGGEA